MQEILVTVGLTAVLSVFGNILYFEYKSRNESEKKILQERLTKLLLPLYYTLQEEDMILQAVINYPDADPYDFDSEKFDRLLRKLKDIISSNLHLANDELHLACLEFLRLAYTTDSHQRLQHLHNQVEDIPDKQLEEFKKIVEAQYFKDRNRYLSLKKKLWYQHLYSRA